VCAIESLEGVRMVDLVIRNGNIVDGTGRAAFRGDLAIDAGVVVHVGGPYAGTGREEIDATGRIVTPGFVDIHAHFDGQVTFDTDLEPSASHGVTTVVFGSCGIGFAPVRPEHHDLMIEVMEFVEDVPGTSLKAGMTWGWETFPEYLDTIEARHYSMDIGTHIGHVAVRTYVMGERGVENAVASQDDIAAMAAIVREGIQAGALGFSTSRVVSHRTGAGEPVPGTYANEDELFGLAAAISDLGRPVFQLAQNGADGIDPEGAIKEIDWMRRLSAEFGLPVSFLVLQTNHSPDLWRDLLDRAWEARLDGAELVPQVANRPFGMLLGLSTRHPFTKRATFAATAARTATLGELAAELARPEIKAAILAETDTIETDDRMDGTGSIPLMLPDMVYLLDEIPDYEQTADRSLASLAAAAGEEVASYFYDRMLAHDGGQIFLVPFFNYSEGNADVLYDMLTHPATVAGLGDAGAHLAMICDASMPTYQLSHWVKGRTRGAKLSLEAAVKMQTADTAALYGLGDRGTLEVGQKGDVNVIDLDRLELTPPVAMHDLPANGLRLLQGAVGYDATIVSGVVTRRHDADTGARPGRLVRGPR
jgi:N-acyl-D-amino-acid deacylase